MRGFPQETASEACIRTVPTVCEVVNKSEEGDRYSPPRIGGVAAHQEKAAKPPLKAQTGWSFWTDHPVRAFQRLPSAIFFDGTSTPPILGACPSNGPAMTKKRG
jgi:hypothetical protein